MSRKLLILIIIVGTLGAVLIWGSGNKKNAASPLDDFAKCLAGKGAVMYGAVWCAHCQDQKNLFGDSFKYVSYVECPDEPQKCLSEGVAGYPTWAFPDGRKLAGKQTLEKLSQESGCPLPQ